MIVGLEPPVDRISSKESAPPIDVELTEGRHAQLDPDDPRAVGYARVLDGLRRLRLPVYLEIDPATSTITRLLIPHVTRIDRIQPLSVGAYSVVLQRSHAQHVLRRDTSGFTDMVNLLRGAADSGAAVIVTENDVHEIIDVRAYIPDPNAPPLPPIPTPIVPQPNLIARILELLRRLRLLALVTWLFGAISEDRARQAFDMVNATSCDPATVPPPCIPFLYPDDGCWARAHEMCRLMIATGLRPRKVWIRAHTMLSVDTKNNPNCIVLWGWHVAATLRVRGPYPQVRVMVIDPSLFQQPVTEQTWKSVQGDPNAALIATDASIYIANMTDPNYTETNKDLAFYRLQLQTRTANSGPPPYAHCP
ncbi:protein-glutamine glutaminase family protein [Nocardia asiatica]|uniref:protein-glutamine glutaminase family protein n=1 Tax=Nocardia asiatica TaxID=209252 RepID=UPI0005C25E00|nr:protein-glutamine glutaminase family protein [Nocardia asiatica]